MENTMHTEQTKKTLTPAVNRLKLYAERQGSNGSDIWMIRSETPKLYAEGCTVEYITICGKLFFTFAELQAACAGAKLLLHKDNTITR